MIGRGTLVALSLILAVAGCGGGGGGAFDGDDDRGDDGEVYIDGPEQSCGLETGPWTTDRGDGALDEVRAEVRFPYGDRQGRLIDASFDVTGCALTGFWVEAASAAPCDTTVDGSEHWGRIEWRFDVDGRSFEGTYGDCDDDPVRPWNGRFDG